MIIMIIIARQQRTLLVKTVQMIFCFLSSLMFHVWQNMPIYMSRLRKLHGQRPLPLAYIERDKYRYIPSVGSTLI